MKSCSSSSYSRLLTRALSARSPGCTAALERAGRELSEDAMTIVAFSQPFGVAGIGCESLVSLSIRRSLSWACGVVLSSSSSWCCRGDRANSVASESNAGAFSHLRRFGGGGGVRPRSVSSVSLGPSVGAVGLATVCVLVSARAGGSVGLLRFFALAFSRAACRVASCGGSVQANWTRVRLLNASSCAGICCREYPRRAVLSGAQPPPILTTTDTSTARGVQ